MPPARATSGGSGAGGGGARAGEATGEAVGWWFACRRSGVSEAGAGEAYLVCRIDACGSAGSRAGCVSAWVEDRCVNLDAEQSTPWYVTAAHHVIMLHERPRVEPLAAPFAFEAELVIDLESTKSVALTSETNSY